MIISKNCFSLFAFLFSVVCVSAQKLPDVQERSVFSNAPVKIDGKIENQAYEAYNKNTKLSYTLSNDAKNLYLVLQSVDVNKILMGGITLTVNTSGKKKEKDAVQITYPVIVRQNRGQGQRGQGGGFGQRGGQGNTQGVDSTALLERRKQQAAQFKEIKVLGIETITDTLVSIYNENGIKAAINFDIKGNCFYELAVPLNLLKISAGKSKEFAYSIQVNGRQINVNFANRGDGGGFGGGGFGGGGQQGGNRGGFDPSMFEPTYFWGKYLPVQ